MPKRSKHPGLYLEPRQHRDGVTWVARGPVIRRMFGTATHNLTKHYQFRTRKVCEVWAKRIVEADGLRRSGVGPAMTIEKAVDGYLLDLKQAGYAANTIVGYSWAAREIVRRLGAERPVQTIDRGDLYELRRSVVGGADSTRRAKLRRFGRALHEWREQGLAPLLSTDMIRDCFTPRRGPVTEKPRPRCLTRPEIEAMLGASESAFPRFLLLTGMRVREALGLTWGMVDLKGRLLSLPASLTKTKRARDVRLRWRPTVEDWLHEQERQGELVFCGLTYDRARALLSYHDPKNGRQADGPLRRAVPGLRWKDLRSTCASYFHSLPVPLSHMDRALDLGHSVVTAERNYVDAVHGVAADADTIEGAMGLVVSVAERSPSGGVIHRLA